MAKCWAACLGGCSGKITKEHIVTENVFIGEMLGVRGFPFSRQVHKFIPKKSFESNILCWKHNNELSHKVDTEGIKAFDVFRRVARLTEQRKEKVKATGITLPFERVNYTIDGSNLERWFLKTLINILVDVNEGYQIGSYGGYAGGPSRELVEIVFGEKQFRGGAELYFLSHAGLTWEPMEGVSCVTWIRETQTASYIAAGEFLFYGCPFFLHLVDLGQKSAFLDAKMRNRSVKLHYHLNRINFQLEGDVMQKISFQW